MDRTGQVLTEGQDRAGIERGSVQVLVEGQYRAGIDRRSVEITDTL